uniref:NADH:ubiquinone reductase (H(+)-translocating) n=1 Tax=Brugia timori TaxID=42155 RepID=A0A0R3QUK1_9BILA
LFTMCTKTLIGVMNNNGKIIDSINKSCGIKMVMGKITYIPLICRIGSALTYQETSLAAYSSICHIGFVLLSEISMLYYGKSMALVIVLSHGYTSVLIFYFIGKFYARSLCFIVGNKVSCACDSRAIICLPLGFITFGNVLKHRIINTVNHNTIGTYCIIDLVWADLFLMPILIGGFGAPEIAFPQLVSADSSAF